MRKYFFPMVILFMFLLSACSENGQPTPSEEKNNIHFLVDNEEILELKQTLNYDDNLMSQIDISYVVNLKEGFNFTGFYYEKEMIYNDSGVKIYDLDVTKDINLVAKFEAIKYNITFELNGGLLENIISTYTIVDEVNLNEYVPKKDGYKFIGWYILDDTDEINKVDKINSGSTGDKVFYAEWAKEFKITYMFMDEVLREYVYSEKDEIVGLLKYDVYGYEFAGWYFDSDFKVKVDYIESKSCENVVLYGKYVPKHINVNTIYDIHFDSNGGSLVPSQSITAGNSIVMPENPTKEGYIFTGWYRDKECKNHFESYDYIFSDLTLYACWNKTTDFYHSNSVSSNLIYPKEYDSDNPLNMSVNQCGKQCFYRVNETGIHTIYYSLTSETSYYKRFFIYNETQKVIYEDKEIKSTSTRTNSNQIYAEKGDVISIYVYYFYSCDIEIYFENFNSNTTSNIALGVSEKITFNENYTFEYTKIEGYEFQGYYSRKNGKGDLLTNQQGESLKPLDSLGILNVYPYYKPIEYTINYEYDSNYLAEGETVITKYTCEDGDIILPVLEREGYTFYGWCETEDLTDEILMIDSKKCCDLTLYAKLLPKEYLLNVEPLVEGRIDFDSQGGTEVETQFFDSENKNVIIPAEPTRKGYAFKGWYFDKECTKYCDFSTDFYNDVILYAGWEFINENYVISIDASKYIETPYKTERWLIEDYFAFNIKESGAFSFECDFSAVGATYIYVKVFNITQGTIYNEYERRSIYPGVGYTNTVYVTAQKGDVIVVEVDTNDRSVEPRQQIIKFNNYKYNAPSINFDKTKQYISYNNSFVLDYKEIPGLSFVGYFTEENGQGIQLTDKYGTSITNWTYLEIMNAYAYYVEATYSITYNCDDGIFVDDDVPLMFKYDSESISLPTLTKAGYEFDGWYLSNDFSDDPIKTIETGTYNDLVLYAKFIPNKYVIYVNNDFVYKISFITNSESIIEEQFITRENPKIIIPSAPIKEGFGFKGWYDDIECTKYHDFDSPIVDNLVLYAGWEEFKYKTVVSSVAINPKDYNKESKALYQEIGLEYTKNNYLQLYFRAEKTGTFKFYYKNGISSDSKYSVNWELYNETQQITCASGSFSHYSYFNYKTINVNEGDVLSLYLTQYRGYETAAQFYFKEYQTISNLGEYGNYEFIVEYGEKYTIPYLEKENLKFIGYYTDENGQGLKITDEFGNSLIEWKRLENLTVYAYYK